jgi:diguanylate cyclase (GGDEF)-like protein
MPYSPAASASARSRTSLILAGVGLIVALLSGGLQLQQETARHAEQLAHELRTLPLLYAEPLAKSLASAQPELTDLLLRSMLARQGVHGVELQVRDGRRFVAGSTAHDEGSAHSEFNLPQSGQGEMMGSVKVLSEAASLRNTLSQEAAWAMLMQHLLLVLVLVAAAVVVVDRMLLRHLRRLSADAQSFDPTQPPSQFAWLEEPGGHTAELQQLNHAIAHVHASMGEQLKREHKQAQALRAEIERQSQALRAAEQALESKKRELSLLSRTDVLTGLANRREFDDALRREFKRAQRQHSLLALAVLDLDHLKPYNELHGHAAGDELLQRFARLLAERFKRDTDLVARLGGEEFACLLPGFDTATAQSLLEQLREDWRGLALPHGASPVDQMVTVSIGLAGYGAQHPYLSPQGLLQAADEALYIAKHAGRDRLSLAA